MNGEFTRARRFCVAILALLCAGVLFRSNIASALVIRGDDYLYRDDRDAALERYRRALAIEPELEVAADRFTFVSLQRQTPQSLRDAVTVATRFLRRRPDDAPVLADRALCYLHLRQYTFAQRDFERAARSSHAASDYVFAGWAAHRAGNGPRAVALWRQALRVRPHYRPALLALSEHAE